MSKSRAEAKISALEENQKSENDKAYRPENKGSLLKLVKKSNLEIPEEKVDKEEELTRKLRSLRFKAKELDLQLSNQNLSILQAKLESIIFQLSLIEMQLSSEEEIDSESRINQLEQQLRVIQERFDAGTEKKHARESVPGQKESSSPLGGNKADQGGGGSGEGEGPTDDENKIKEQIKDAELKMQTAKRIGIIEPDTEFYEQIKLDIMLARSDWIIMTKTKNEVKKRQKKELIQRTLNSVDMILILAENIKDLNQFSFEARKIENREIREEVSIRIDRLSDYISFQKNSLNNDNTNSFSSLSKSFKSALDKIKQDMDILVGRDLQDKKSKERDLARAFDEKTEEYKRKSLQESKLTKESKIRDQSSKQPQEQAQTRFEEDSQEKVKEEAVKISGYDFLKPISDELLRKQWPLIIELWKENKTEDVKNVIQKTVSILVKNIYGLAEEYIYLHKPMIQMISTSIFGRISEIVEQATKGVKLNVFQRMSRNKEAIKAIKSFSMIQPDQISRVFSAAIAKHADQSLHVDEHLIDDERELQSRINFLKEQSAKSKTTHSPKKIARLKSLVRAGAVGLGIMVGLATYESIKDIGNCEPEDTTEIDKEIQKKVKKIIDQGIDDEKKAKAKTEIITEPFEDGSHISSQKDVVGQDKNISKGESSQEKPNQAGRDKADLFDKSPAISLAKANKDTKPQTKSESRANIKISDLLKEQQKRKRPGKNQSEIARREMKKMGLAPKKLRLETKQSIEEKGSKVIRDLAPLNVAQIADNIMFAKMPKSNESYKKYGYADYITKQCNSGLLEELPNKYAPMDSKNALDDVDEFLDQMRALAKKGNKEGIKHLIEWNLMNWQEHF
ncbi:MAG: hypothetical protein ABH832_00350 [bacterium]